MTNAELERALDRDGDGYQPVVAGGPDCDEQRADVNPGMPERCGDGVDNDCDGRIDDVGLGERTWYLDVDRDGFGVNETTQACTEPEGYAPEAGDCDDTDPSRSPAAEDLCDGLDQDCDGVVDNDADALIQFRDADGDGFGVDSDTVVGCGLTPGYVLSPGDCDDAVEGINPAADDVCDRVDQDCDGAVDDDVVFTLQFMDADGDGEGDPDSAVSACENLPHHVGTSGDCDDTDPTVHINAIDFCDGLDQDCDFSIDNDALFEVYWFDGDGDGVGTSSSTLDSCAPVDSYSVLNGDCDDTDPGISPLVDDGCDGVDSDCDGAIDDDALLTLYFPDHDEDGVGALVGAVEACIPPAGFVQLTGDCNDQDAGIRPDNPDVCDGLDQDCDGAVDEDAEFAVWFADHDGDGLGDLAGLVQTCDGAPEGFVEAPGDCDDGMRPSPFRCGSATRTGMATGPSKRWRSAGSPWGSRPRRETATTTRRSQILG